MHGPSGYQVFLKYYTIGLIQEKVRADGHSVS